MGVVVIGAGVIGMATAYALRRGGEDVLVIDRQPGPGLEASFANGALLHPSLAEPWNSPGILKVLVGSIGREDAAVLLRLHALPQLIGWGLRFLRESNPERFKCNALKNIRLAQYSLECMAALRAATSIDYHYYRRGILTVFRDVGARDAALRWYEGLARHGLDVEACDTASSIDKEPALAPVASCLVGSVFASGDEAGDPHAFCTELRKWLASAGVAFRFDAAVQRITTQSGKVCGIELASGENLSTERLVLAAGSLSPVLAWSAGLRIPVRPAKGYSLTLPRGTSGTAPSMPVSDTSLHMAVIPVGENRLRVAGTAEFTGYDTSVNPDRVRNLLRLLQQLYPLFAAASEGVEPSAWTGLRPMCPDGVPLIGPTRIDGLYLNTGHGHVGWTLAAGSGQLLADLMQGRPPRVDGSSYAPGRFV